MKVSRVISVLIALVVVLATITPASAQLGSADESQISIQNISGSSATVTVKFYGGSCPSNGCQPSPLNAAGTLTNPFTLNVGSSVHINVSEIQTAQLPAGQYSVVIESTAQVVAVATVLSGGGGSTRFEGSYTSFSTGGTTFFLPSFVYHYVMVDWYSMISVQNLGSSPTNILVTITCSEPAAYRGLVGTLTANNIPPNGQATFAVKNVRPSGFPVGAQCNGSAVVQSTSNPPQPIVAVDNQSTPVHGATVSFSGTLSGATKFYAPALFVNYAPSDVGGGVIRSWNSSINIIKMAPGDTTVTVTYSNGGTPTTCNLGDVSPKLPGCLLYMPTVHNTPGTFGATIQSSNGIPIAVLVNATKHPLSQTYEGLSIGTTTSFVPIIMKYYFQWISSFSCMNTGTVPTTMNVKYGPDPALAYAGYNYNTSLLQPGNNTEILSFLDNNLPNGYLGNVTVTAQAVGAKIACTSGFTLPSKSFVEPGDWNTRFSAFGQ